MAAEVSRWFEELKRRRVFRALVGYGIAAFAILQIVEPVMHGLQWPDWVLSALVVALGVGFPIIVVLAWVFDLKSTGVERTAPSPFLGGARLLAVLVGLGLAAAAPGIVYFFFLRGGARPSPAASIAVLPFEDMSSGRDQAFFADGIAEEILDSLAHVEGLRVAGRTSSFSFKGKSDDIRSIGQKLSVATVLEGSVRKEGNRVRITAQLLNATDGFHLWSQTFDRELAGIFVAQDEISKAVVAALRVKLLPGQQPRRHPVNPEVYNEYLLGKQFFHQLTSEGNRRAVAAFERALALDPEFAPAWAGLGLATFWVADVSESGAVIRQGYERAMQAAEKAVALDPDLAEAYATRGFLRSTIRWDWEGARADFQRSLALNPGASETHRWYSGTVLMPLGKSAEAVAEARRAADLDPLSAAAWGRLGRVLTMNGELEPGRAAFERALQILPEQNYAAGNLAVTFLLQKRPAESLTAAEKSPLELFRVQGKALALHDLGRDEEAHRLLDELIARYSQSSAFQIAEVYAWFGESDNAFRWLERAYQQHDSGMSDLKTDALLRGIRGDPRFKALLRKMNLPPD
jgi:TolB-like protein/tetratricopeptide (TPR) repeat protein